MAIQSETTNKIANVVNRSATLRDYLKRKSEIALAQPVYREVCVQCRKSKLTCYCQHVAAIATQPRIVILIHPMEARRTVATGRMAHRCLSNSTLIEGVDFTDNDQVNAIIADPKVNPVVLYPKRDSIDISNPENLSAVPLIDDGRELVVFVIDGTWHGAKKMINRSQNLQRLKRICFQPRKLSRFMVRKQPRPQCLSTIEAIHEVLDLLDPAAELSTQKPHGILLSVFDQMVKQQLSFRQALSARHAAGREARYQRRLARSIDAP